MDYILSKGRNATHANVAVVNIWSLRLKMEIKSRKGEEKVELDTALRCSISISSLRLASGRQDKAGATERD